MTTATRVAAPNCPTWCESRATDHADDEMGQRWGEWFHGSDVLNADGMRVRLIFMECRPEPIAGDDYGVFVDISEDSALTPQQARMLSAAIASAAEMMEGTSVANPAYVGRGPAR